MVRVVSCMLVACTAVMLGGAQAHAGGACDPNNPHHCYAKVAVHTAIWRNTSQGECGHHTGDYWDQNCSAGDKDLGDHCPGTADDHEMADGVVIQADPHVESPVVYYDTHQGGSTTVMVCYHYVPSGGGMALTIFDVDDTHSNYGDEGGSSNDTKPDNIGIGKFFY